ncbi:hypothetical protein CFN78_26120 [Amycolatopsis antarctica]|uniref:STAS domain-containing protein n=1 Tax=Amycolatopsis antarctica TaxID=1854586 RepID=A0A263CW88_9PSEU|nr:hypothetical protein CFN78_26120 [Amycolatopsis antarctica]
MVNEVAVVRMHGDVDARTAPVLAERLAQELRRSDRRVVVVDLRGVGVLEPAGLQVLITAQERAREKHVAVRIVADAHAVLEYLTLTSRAHTLIVFPVYAHAVQLLRGHIGPMPPPVPQQGIEQRLHAAGNPQ